MTNPQVPAITIKHLTKRFRRVTALNDLNLKVLPGEVLALLGANGSGKSTTFRLLLNIYRPSEGEATLLGTPSTELNGSNFDKVCYISEGQKMPAWMSIERFLNYCAGFYSDWDHDLCKQLIESFGLNSKQKIKHLSRGQSMKVAVASTLPARPQLLLLDEPFSGLDVETRAQLSDLLKSLAHKDGLAIIITTHDVEEVEPVASRLGILSHGKLCVDEPLQDYLQRHRLLELPANVFENLAEELKRNFRPTRLPNIGSAIFTESYSPELEERLRTHLRSNELATFSPMTIRQILTAHALPLS